MRLYAKKYNNKKSRFARASARFSALALNGNALNCNEKLNVSVDSCSTLASLVPLLACAREQTFPSPKTGKRCLKYGLWFTLIRWGGNPNLQKYVIANEVKQSKKYKTQRDCFVVTLLSMT